MKKHFLTLLAIVLLAIPGAASAAQGVARLTLVEGDVQIRMADGDDWEPAAVNTPLEEGDSIWSPDGSRAEIQIQDGTRIRLGSQSSLDIVDVGDRDLQFHLGMGHAYVRTGDMRDWSYQFDLTESSVRISDKARLRLDITGDGDEDISVFKGDVYVEGYGSKTRVRSGEMLSLEESRSEILPLNQPDSWEKWNRKRDQALRARPEGGNLPAELSAYEDELSTSGEWVAVPEYGRVWRPTVIVTNDWAPYRVGRWVWRDGDYVWISYENWGWAPYHYGRWVVTPRWGWCWVPPVRGDVFWAPAYVGWVTTPSHVGWVPLAPGEVYYGRGHYGRASVNITNVTNVSVNTRIVYRNQTVSGNAVSVVPRDSFAKGRLNFVKVKETTLATGTTSPSRPAPPPQARELRMPLVKPIPATKLPPPKVAGTPARELKHRLPRVEAPPRQRGASAPPKFDRSNQKQRQEQAPGSDRERGPQGEHVSSPAPNQDHQDRGMQREKPARGEKTYTPPAGESGDRPTASRGGAPGNQTGAGQQRVQRGRGEGAVKRVPKNVWKVRPKEGVPAAPAQPPKEQKERRRD